MKILFVSSDNNPSSGAFLSMTMLNRLLRTELGVETMVILPREGNGQSLLGEAGIPFALVPSRDWVVPVVDKPRLRTLVKRWCKRAYTFFLNQRASSRIARIAREGGFELIHINTPSAYVGALAAKKAHLPVVWHLRELLEEDQGRMIWDKARGYALIGQSARVIAISQCVYDKYAALVDPSRLRLVFNGIDTSVFYRPGRTVFRSPKITMVYGGGYAVRKGAYELLSGLSLLADSHTVDFELLLIGETNEKFNKAIASSSLAPHVRFLGYQKNVVQWYEQADIAFTCSAMEAFGRKTVEAMLAGALIVAANTGGSLDIVRDKENGLLYTQGDPVSLYTTTLWAIEHAALCRSLAQQGQHDAREHFNARENARNVKQIYQEILEAQS